MFEICLNFDHEIEKMQANFPKKREKIFFIFIHYSICQILQFINLTLSDWKF